jgi:phosphoserine phosphatase
MASASLPATVLVHFSGPDKPGLTAAPTGVLVEQNMRILDIGQSVVHENVSLGLLLELPPVCGFGTLRSVLHHRA